MSDSTDLERCSLITNVCTPPQNFGFLEIVQSLIFVWYEEFPWVCCSLWEDKTYFLPCVLFGHKSVGKSLQNTISDMASNSKNNQITSKCSNENTQKQTNITS